MATIKEKALSTILIRRAFIYDPETDYITRTMSYGRAQEEV